MFSKVGSQGTRRTTSRSLVEVPLTVSACPWVCMMVGEVPSPETSGHARTQAGPSGCSWVLGSSKHVAGSSWECLSCVVYVSIIWLSTCSQDFLSGHLAQNWK